MPNVYIIMGEDDARKSSTIRALTGISKKRVYKIATNGKDIDIFVRISSLQEEKVSPQSFIEKVNQNNYSNVLVSLWVSQSKKQPNEFPNGFTYIQNFLNAGWNIQQIVVLGTDNLQCNLSQNAPNPNYIPDSQNLPANLIASQVREWWQWL